MLRSSTLTLALLAALAPRAAADVTAYTQDFESLVLTDPAALGNDGFKVFANVFSPGGAYLYGYGVFPAPNGGAGFSALATGLGGPTQGAQQLNIYSDYNNGDHNNGNLIEALVFREQTIGAVNAGQVWRFTFDYLQNPTVVNGAGATTTFAFVKVLQSSTGSFATLAQQEFETTGASTTAWGTASIDFTIDPSFAGELLQFGFRSVATNYRDSSRLYDNLSWTLQGGNPPSLATYSQDFEGVNMADPAALSGDGYKIFATVTDPAGNFLYNYGVFPAPNGGPGFSSVATGAGGPFQGSQYMNVYSDYGNGDHGNGNLIEALVFREQLIGAVDVGATWRVRFDALRNAAVVNGQGNSTMSAFLKVLKVSDGSFATLALVEVDTTGASTTAWSSYALDLLIAPTFAGELLQMGFGSIATAYSDTGRFYDNLELSPLAAPGLGQTVCLGNPNSTGAGALLTVTGSAQVAANSMTLGVSQLPVGALGYFLQSSNRGITFNPAGSQGHLCLAGPAIGRYAGNVLAADAGGSVSLAIDLTSLPAPAGSVLAVAGETRYFQYWTRDSSFGVAVSNFSSAVGVTFE